MESKALPILGPEELRVLGALMEKSKTTPEYYPMTLNGLQSACNQKTSRKPVVSYDEGTLITALDSLRKKSLISTVVGGGSRVTKYKHNLAIQYPLLPQELAVLCLLILRGPLTPGEINSSSGRLYDFESIEEVQSFLQKLSEGENPFVKSIGKRPGQKEIRYVHLLGEFDEDAFEESATTGHTESPSKIKDLEERISTLEDRLESLQIDFDKLIKELT